LYGKLPRLAESQVTSQANHDHASQYALTPAETRRSANALAERSGEQGHYDIGRGVERNRERAQQNKLQKDVSAAPVYKLGNKREKKQSRLGIQHFGHDSLPERISSARQAGEGNALIFSGIENHANPEEAKIACAE